MHREIQIKQFPIVITHWWPKTRNERLCEKTNSIYIVFYLLYNHVQVIWVRTHPVCDVVCVCVCDVCVRALWLSLTEGVSEAWCWRAVIVTTPITYFSGVAWTGLGICMRRSDWLTPPLALEKLRQHHDSDTPSVKREPERAHTRHTPDACVHSDHLDMVVYKR